MDETPATIALTADSWEELARSAPPGAPVLTINLLRFRDEALYPEGEAHPPCSGREAYYRRYAAKTVPIARAQGGVVVLNGSAIGHPLCPPGERWDAVLIFEYPDIAALIALGAHPTYQAVAIHRTAALRDSRLFIIARDSIDDLIGGEGG